MPWYSINRTKRTKSSHRRRAEASGASAYPDVYVDQGVSGWSQDEQDYVGTDGQNEPADSSSYDPQARGVMLNLTGASFDMPTIDVGDNDDGALEIKMKGWPSATFSSHGFDAHNTRYFVPPTFEQVDTAIRYIRSQDFLWGDPDGFGGTWIDKDMLTEALKEHCLPSGDQLGSVQCYDEFSYGQEAAARLKTKLDMTEDVGRWVYLHIVPALPKDEYQYHAERDLWLAEGGT